MLGRPPSMRPNSKLAEMMKNRGFKAQRPTLSPSSVSTTKALKVMTPPRMAIRMPSISGKYPGPIRAAVPKLYLVAPQAKATPTAVNKRPEKKSF